MKIRKILEKKAHIIFFIFAIITGTVLGYFSALEKTVPFQTYNGLEVELIDKLVNETDEAQYREIIENNKAIKKIDLVNGDRVVQKLALTTNMLSEIKMDIDVYNNCDLMVKIMDEEGKTIREDKLSVAPENRKLVISVDGLQHDRMDIFYVELKVTSDYSKTSLAVYGSDYSDGTLTINSKEQKNVLLTSVNGSIVIYKQKSIVGLSLITTILALLTIVFYIRQGKYKEKLQQGMNYILSSKWKMYGIEGIGYIFILLTGLRFYTSYTYQADLNVLSLYLLITISSFWGSFVYFMLKKYRYSIQDIYAILAIPLGLSFVFLMLPDQVPDEHAHFAKAYLTSTGNFTNTVDVNISTAYGPLALRNYNDILPAIFQFGNYSDTITYNHACPYNFLLYILPSIGIFICRVINLSIYFAYYIGRMINVLLFIYIGYSCIKKVPVAKYVFFVYLFNPMVLQQAASYSADAMVHSLLIIVVVYFLWLYSKEEALSNRSIITVFLLILLVAICKYAYLPVFAIYLLLYKKILKMNKKQIYLFIGCLFAVVLGYLIMATLTGPAGNMGSMDEYLIEKKVNPLEQIKYMLAHPKGTYYMLQQTLMINRIFYVQSFVGLFSWLTVTLSQPITFLYLAVMFITPLLVDEKIQFKITQRLWIALIGIGNMLLIIFAMYITWTTVGAGYAEGVQGRYFIPLVILVLLAYSGSKKIVIKHPVRICVATVVIVNIAALSSIMNYFIFLV